MGRSYGAARGLVWFMEILGWIAVLGALAGVAAAFRWRPAGIDPAFLLLCGAAGVVAGLFLVAMAQVVRAQVDTALHTAEMVELLRRDRARAPAGSASGATVTPLAAPAAPRIVPAGRAEPPLTRP